MKPISTFAHGIADYTVGILLLLAPNLLGFADVGGPAVMVPRIIGSIIILQSLITRYELSVAKLLPMKAHLINDYVASVVLAASPWLFDFKSDDLRQWVPHVVVGLGSLLITALTDPRYQPVAHPSHSTHAHPHLR